MSEQHPKNIRRSGDLGLAFVDFNSATFGDTRGVQAGACSMLHKTEPTKPKETGFDIASVESFQEGPL